MKTVFFILGLLWFPRLGEAQIYVAVNGSDHNDGTIAYPKATLHAALRQAREMRRLKDPVVAQGVRIMLKGGVYHLHEPVFIRPEDAGTVGSPTIIMAADDTQPVLSGGVKVSGWKKTNVPGLQAKAKGKVWVADAPVANFRQLWIGHRKAVRARDTMRRILSWDHAAEQCEIPKPAIQYAKGLEMFIHQWWAIARLRIKAMEVRGDSARLSFHQPESRIQSEHPWPAPWISTKTGNSGFYLENALQLLDEPGEWFLDTERQQIIYWPREDEDLRRDEAIVPLLETLVKVEGTIDAPVSHIYFQGIGFQHTTWMRPAQYGHVPLQAGMYLLDAYKLKPPGTPEKKGLENQAWIGRQPAAVQLSFVSHTQFKNCRFSHLAATALDYIKGTDNDHVNGNVFTDIGGTAIQAGTFSDEAFETHLPYLPSDERVLCRYLDISNNFISGCGNEDWGCTGISAGYVQNISIVHNELCDLPYTGISLGWGWTKSVNAMRNNRVHANLIHHYAKHMYDVSGIYTLSAQPGSEISENAVHTVLKAPFAHDPNHWFYLYLDEGSSYFTVKDNWTEGDKFLQNANGPGNTWTNNGPGVHDSIRAKAGLEPDYKHLNRSN